jgi:hypothetical protein
LAQVFDFAANISALAVERLQFTQLPLNSRQFVRSGRIGTIAIARSSPGLDHREQQLCAGEHRANVGCLHCVQFHRMDGNLT